MTSSYGHAHSLATTYCHNGDRNVATVTVTVDDEPQHICATCALADITSQIVVREPVPLPDAGHPAWDDLAEVTRGHRVRLWRAVDGRYGFMAFDADGKLVGLSDATWASAGAAAHAAVGSTTATEVAA